MKVLHVTSYFMTHESRVLRVTESVIRLGYAKKIEILGSGRVDLPSIERIDSERTIVRVRSNLPRNILGRGIGFVGWSAKVLMRFRSRGYSLICCHSLACLPVSFLLAKLNKASLIYEPHELETETARVPRGPVRCIARWTERLLARQAHAVIVVGREIASWYRKELGLKRVLVVMNCPPRADWRQSDLIRQTVKSSPDLPIFLYQGILSEGRGLESTIAAFRHLEHEAVLVMVGDGSYRERLRAQARGLRNVFILPAVPPVELHRWTSSADFGLSLIEPISRSYEYCLPNKLFEYLMARLPVLVSATTEQSRIVEDFGVGRVCSRIDPADIRSEVRLMIAEGASKYQSALDRARNEYCWENQEKVLNTIYGEIARLHAGSNTPATDEGFR